MDAESLERLRADLEVGDGLWPDHVPFLEAFLLCETQWRVVVVTEANLQSRLRFTGLDYAGCRVGLELAGVAVTPELWGSLRLMERAVISGQYEGRR